MLLGTFGFRWKTQAMSGNTRLRRDVYFSDQCPSDHHGCRAGVRHQPNTTGKQLLIQLVSALQRFPVRKEHLNPFVG